MSIPTTLRVYIGTANNHPDDGIHTATLDLATGALSTPVLAAPLTSPAFLCLHPNKPVLFSTAKEPGPDAVHAFRLHPESGTLDRINGQSAEDCRFCHISTDHKGNVLMGADYHTSKAAVFPLAIDGSIELVETIVHHATASNVVPDRQQVPHVHSVTPDPSGRYAVVCDFSADALAAYRLNTDGAGLQKVASADAQPGDGPRHLVFHPSGRWLYVINELSTSVTVYTWDQERPSIESRQQVSMLPAGFTGENTAAEIALSPDGRYLYASNRGLDTIDWFRVDEEDGQLAHVGAVSSGGEHPRNFTIDPTGRFMLVANRDSDRVCVFRIDPDSGAPVETEHGLTVRKPMGISIL